MTEITPGKVPATPMPLLKQSHSSKHNGHPSYVDPSVEPQYITGPRLYLLLFALVLVIFTIMLDQTILATAIPHITSDFNSLKDIGWYGAIYLITTCSFQPLTGKLYQYYSPKILFLIGTGLFAAGSLMCALAVSSPMLIVGRGISGIGGAGLITGMLTILIASVGSAKRPMYLGFMMGVSSLGLVLGPILGGLLTQHASWRWCFYINLPFSATTAALLSFLTIPSLVVPLGNTPISGHLDRLDLPGFASFTAAIIMMLLALQWGGVTYPWDSATIIGLLCGSVVTLVVFLIIEKFKKDDAMLPVTIIRDQIVACSALTAMISSGSTLLITYYLPIWFQVVKGASPTMGGVYFLPFVFSQLVGSVVSGILVTKTGYYTPFSIIGGALSAIGFGLMTTLDPGSSVGTSAGYQIISGIARGIMQQQPLTAVQTVISKEQSSIGNAFIMFVQILGGALYLCFGQVLFTNQLSSALHKYAPTVNTELILSAGATSFRDLVTAEEVAGVVQAYNQALARIFFLGVGGTCFAFFTSWGMGWASLKTTKEAEADEAVKEKKGVN